LQPKLPTAAEINVVLGELAGITVQRERVDKELSGEPETGLTKRSGNRVLLDGTEKTLATL